MGRDVHGHDGVVHKIVGDEVINRPVPLPAQAATCVFWLRVIILLIPPSNIAIKCKCTESMIQGLLSLHQGKLGFCQDILALFRGSIHFTAR